MEFSLHMGLFHLCASSYRAFEAGKRSILRRNFDCNFFSDLPKVPAPLCDHEL